MTAKQMVPDGHLVGLIDAVLLSGKSSVARAVAKNNADAAGNSRALQARVDATMGFVDALNQCLDEVGRSLAESGVGKDVALIRSTRLKVITFVEECINTHSRSLLTAPVSRGSASQIIYSEEEQLRDRMEAQADIMFYRVTA